MDPKKAPKESLRGTILADWKALGLKSEPNVGDNGVHASASPYEGLAERLNWLKADLSSDSFGQSLLAAGVSAKFITDGGVDPQVATDASGSMGSLFDALEDINADECVATMV